MSHRTRIWTVMIAFGLINCAAYGMAPDDVTQPVASTGTPAPIDNTAAPQNAHYEHPSTDMPFISINTDSALDLNWAAALEFSDPALRPTPVTLPFLTDYPFDNLEIKLRVLNLKF